MRLSAGQLARMIDHTLLKAETTPAQIEALCAEAIEYGFKAVCVNPIHVRRAAALISEAARGATGAVIPVVASVAGFPLGASTAETKADEARRALDDGAVEIDMVADIGALIAGERRTVRKDIEAVARVVHGRRPQGILKVILETATLTEEQTILGCRCCAEGEADFVKTSTGFHASGGATLESVRRLHRHASPILVKAAGGIRSAAHALAFAEAGASRIGTSSAVTIMREMRDSGS